MVAMLRVRTALMVVAAFLLANGVAEPELRQSKVVPSLEDEKRVVFSRENPGKWLRKASSHVPRVHLDDDIKTAKVKVPHEMSAEHSINFVYIRDQNGKVIFSKDLLPEDEPVFKIKLAEETTAVTAYCHCNLHGLWKSAEVTLASVRDEL